MPNLPDQQNHYRQPLNHRRQGKYQHAAILHLMLKRGWVTRQLDSRALNVTSKGRDALSKAFSG